MMKQRPSPKVPIRDRVLNATSTFLSYLLPFTTAVPVHLTRKSRPSRSTHQDAFTSYNDLGVDIALSRPSSTPQRKGSWISKPRSERRQSCRRLNNSRQRDWSGELEESEFHLPFPVATEERERPHPRDSPEYIGQGGLPAQRQRGLGGSGTVGDRSRGVSFRDEFVQLPKLEIASLSIGGAQGLMIDMNDEMDSEEASMMMPSSATTESSDMTRGSEWIEFSEEAEGIEMLF